MRHPFNWVRMYALALEYAESRRGMVDGSDQGRNATDARFAGARVNASSVNDWFVREVLPLEGALMQFLNRCLRNPSDAADLRQDVYVRVYETATKKFPDPVRPFVMTMARNLVIDRIRHKQVVSIEAVADLEQMGFVSDDPGPERAAVAHSELGRLRRALDRLPQRCREAMILRKIEGLSRREIAARMSISEAVVAEHLAAGMRVILEVLHDPFSDGGGA
jgi:RNA polymerase sigma factor (sigma-70 family)